jgi:hypothetical protein
MLETIRNLAAAGKGDHIPLLVSERTRVPCSSVLLHDMAYGTGKSG